MKLVLKTNLRHDGENFDVGDEIELEAEAAEALLAEGSAVIPGTEGVAPDVAAELGELRAELEDAEEAIDGLKSVNGELNDKCENLEASLDNAKAENSALHAQIESQKKDIADLRKELTAAKKAAKAPSATEPEKPADE